MSKNEFAALKLELNRWRLEIQLDFVRDMLAIVDPELWREPQPKGDGR
jgi:hypothetical protein